MNTNNSRIAKNTILLYVRMFLIMVVSLYTVRIILNTLGVVDYGIYNVVGGIVSMFSFLSGTMASASQRFFSFEIGRNNFEQLKKTFSTSFILYLGIALVILLLSETIGLWFLNNKMTIPTDRMNAANWVYQFSVFSFLITIITIPYNASIIAHEDMSIYAYVGIVEVVLKLVVAYLLVFFTIDKLKLYSILLFFSTLLVCSSYRFICIKKYKECKSLSISFDKNLIGNILSYSGWNMIGAMANVFKIYGTNIILNLFFGPVLNAARGIAFQIQAALSSFVMNFYMAVRPQITKTYASGDKAYMWRLVFQSAKISFYLILLISMPLLIETDFILKLWLKNFPNRSIIFSRLLIVNVLIELFNNQLVAALQAANKIKLYQSIVSIMLLMVLPISYIAFRFGAAPEMTFNLSILVTILCFIPQIIVVKREIGLSINHYIKNVIFPMICVGVVSFILPIFIHISMPMSWFRFFLVLIASVCSCIATTYLLGFSKTERVYIIDILKEKLKIR